MCGIRRDERNWQNREASNTDDICGDIVHSLASSGGKAAYPPYGGFQSHPLRGWILYLPAGSGYNCPSQQIPCQEGGLVFGAVL
jgi:hypothetical protein